ncbi:MAG TPA: LysM domain-containing protein [Capillimicrobium sp.]
MTRRLARIVAPLAILAVVAAIFLIVTTTLRDDSGESASSGDTPTQAGNASDDGVDEPTRPKRKRKQPKTYTVQTGDILSTVSEQTGVSVEELQELNPDVDPQALQVGQVLKLTPGAGSDDAAADGETTTTTTP